MAKKWADYLITGVWFTGNRVISHVLIHLDKVDVVGKGKKMSEAEVIKLRKQGYTIKTAVWNYVTGSFNEGADVDVFPVGSKEYLRTHKNGTVTDNLDNILDMGWLIG